MEVAKVTSKGQITIPISIRRQLEINEGDKVLFIYKPEGVLMVNPNKMQGGSAGDVVDAAETEMAAEAVEAMKKRESSKPPRSESPPAAASSADASRSDSYTTPAAAAPPPPPVEEPAKPEARVGGFDLSTILDDIRSIGSNI